MLKGQLTQISHRIRLEDKLNQKTKTNSSHCIIAMTGGGGGGLVGAMQGCREGVWLGLCRASGGRGGVFQ